MGPIDDDVIINASHGLVPNRHQTIYINDYPSQSLIFNPLRAKFFKGNINIYLHFVITPHWYDTGT